MSPAEWCTCSFSAHTDCNEAECKCWFDVTALLQTASLLNAPPWMHSFPLMYFMYTLYIDITVILYAALFPLHFMFEFTSIPYLLARGGKCTIWQTFKKIQMF